MDQERPVENLLRRYAKQRRQQAGEPFELHSASRRELQSEVAHAFPAKSSAIGNWLRLFTVPRLAWAGAAVAVFLTALMIWVPKREHSSLMAQNESSKNTLAQAPMESADAAGNKLVAEPQRDGGALSRAMADKDVLVAETPLEARSLKKEAVMPPSGEELAANAPAVAVPNSAAGGGAGFGGGAAPGAATKAKDAETLVRMRVTSNPVSLAAAPAAAAPAISTATAPSGVVHETEATDSFQPSQAGVRFSDQTRQQESPALALSPTQVTSRLTAKAPAQVPQQANGVLVSFTLEQAGQQLWVVDQDGSIYTGLIQPAVEPGVNVTLRTDSAPAPTRGFQTQRIAPRTKGSAVPVDAKQSTPSSYFFQVEGTNRTLNQKVFFSGNLWPTNAPAGGRVGSVPATPTSSNQWLLNATVSGKVVVNDGQQIEIKAAPMPR